MPDFSANLLHERPTELTFYGDHPLDPGDVVRFQPLATGGCHGAASADSSRYGGALDEKLSILRKAVEAGALSDTLFEQARQELVAA